MIHNLLGGYMQYVFKLNTSAYIQGLKPSVLVS